MTDRSISLADRSAQRRRITRYKMFGPVSLNYRGDTLRAHFLDLSTGGALAHSETPPIQGSYVSVEASGLKSSGRVMWVSGKRFGIQFSEPMSDVAMQALIQGD